MNLTAQDTISSADLLSITKFSAPHLTKLEADGVIARAAKNSWPLIETLANIIQHLRAANRRGRRSEASDRLATMKANALEQKIAKEAAELIPASEVEEHFVLFVGQVTAKLVAIPPRFTQNLAERRRLEQLIDEARRDIADLMEQHAAEIEAAGPP
jgi:hypothetical protein